MIYDIDPKSTALVILDPQREYFDPGGPLYTTNAAAILPNLTKLREASRRAGIKTILVKHVHRADGSDVGRMGDFDPTPVFVEGSTGVELVAEMTPRTNETVITKSRYSAFIGTPLERILIAERIDTIIVSGLMTNYCSVTTARHAHDLDYKVLFVADANAGPDMPDLGFGPVPHPEVMRVIATSLAGGVAEVVTTSEVLRRLQGNSVRS